MKICLFTIILPVHYIGGMQIHAKELSRGLARRGHDVTVITTAHPKGLEYEEIDGVKTHYLNTRPDKYSKEWWDESIRKFRELQEKTEFDVVLAESIAGWGYVKNNLKGEYRIPFVCIQHGVASSEMKARLRDSKSLRNLMAALRKIRDYLFVDLRYLRRSDAIIAVNNMLRDKIVREHFIAEEKVYTVFNGVDTDMFNPNVDSGGIRRRYDIKNEKIILYAGRIVENKGIQYVIEALPEVLENVKVKLFVVGDGPYVGELKVLSNKLDLSKHIFFCGGVTNRELPEYYNAGDLVVFPTLHNEGLGSLMLLEAMACGTPVIASKTSSLVKAVEDQVDIIFAQSKDEESWAKAITKVLTDEKLAGRISGNARKKILEGYSFDMMVDNTLKVLEHVVGQVK